MCNIFYGCEVRGTRIRVFLLGQTLAMHHVPEKNCYAILIFIGGQMKKILLLMLVLASVFLFGCRFKSDNITVYELPEGAEIQKTLDILADSVLSMNIEGYMSCFSADCAFFNKINKNILSVRAQNIKYKNFSVSIKGLKRYGEGLEAIVNTQWETLSDGKRKSGEQTRSIYFSKEKETWKIKDYYFRTYIRPSVVVGNSSLLFANAQGMAKALTSKLFLDIDHIQSSGDLILLGTAYDNASILEMEKENSTYIKVTENYPGNDLGIVQVIPNAGDYRHVIVIQGSSLRGAKNAISFMTQYLTQNSYMEPGVYLIQDDKIRKAELLELTTLTTLDYNKAEDTLSKVQNVVEYNIKLISDEIALEKDNIHLIEKNISNSNKKDYKEAFSVNSAAKKQSQSIRMGIISSYFMNKDVCTKAFQLPPKADAEALDAALMLSSDMDISSVTALLRLTGFLGDEVFSLEGEDASVIFANTGDGHALDPDMPFIHGVNRQYTLEELRSIENDGYYLNLKDNSTNMPKEDIINNINAINKVFSLKKELLPSRLVRKSFAQNEELVNNLIPFNTLDIYEKLQNNAPYFQYSNSMSSLSEAKDALRTAMGELLSLKCRKYILNLAGKYPGSQYDYSRYSAGLAFVEKPEAYAEAARESAVVKVKASEIGSSNRERENKIEGILSLLSTIKIEEKAMDFFLHPEACLKYKKGGAMDKALLAYGLYTGLFGKSDETWVAISENSSYVVIKDEYGYKYIDCKYNALSRMPDPTIYLCFNEKHAYNTRLGIGEKPEFMR